MYMCICEKSMKHISVKKGRQDDMQSRPLHRMHFGQYQALWAVLERPGDGDCYFMHKMPSGALHYVTTPGSEGLCHVIVRYSLYLNTHIHVLTTCVSVELTSYDIMWHHVTIMWVICNGKELQVPHPPHLKIDGWRWVAGFNSHYAWIHLGRGLKIIFADLEERERGKR